MMTCFGGRRLCYLTERSAALPPLPLPLALPATVVSPAQGNRMSELSLGRVVSRIIRTGHLQDRGCVPLCLGVPQPRVRTREEGDGAGDDGGHAVPNLVAPVILALGT